MSEQTKIKPRTLSGFMELLPSEQIAFNAMYDKIRRTYERFGFLPIDTPVLEAAEILLAKENGETGKQIYEARQKNSPDDASLAMRFDLTVPLAKYAALYNDKLAFPFKRYQIGKVYRGERAQAGRFREFFQADIDIIGDGKLDLLYDAEIPAVISAALHELNIGEFIIKINNRKIPSGLLADMNLDAKSAEILIILDKRDKIGDAGVIAELVKLGIAKDKITQIVRFASIAGTNERVIRELKSLGVKNEQFNLGIAELESVAHAMAKLGVPEKNFCIDTKIIRGLGYYTGTVYETFIVGHENFGSISSGGRYEDLANYYTEKKMPGVGMSIGLTRLFDQLLRAGLIKTDKKTTTDVLVLPLCAEAVTACMNAATILRAANVNAEVYFEDKKTANKFAYADKLGIAYALIIGPDEIAAHKFALRNLASRTQETLTLPEVLNALSRLKPIP